MFGNELLKIFEDPVFGALLIGVAFVIIPAFFYIIFLVILLRIRKESIQTSRNLFVLIDYFLKRETPNSEKRKIEVRGRIKLDDKDIQILKDYGVGME
jgi:hypothetical protein